LRTGRYQLGAQLGFEAFGAPRAEATATALESGVFGLLFVVGLLSWPDSDFLVGTKVIAECITHVFARGAEVEAFVAVLAFVEPALKVLGAECVARHQVGFGQVHLVALAETRRCFTQCRVSVDRHVLLCILFAFYSSEAITRSEAVHLI